MKRSILLSVMFIAGILGVLGFTAAQFIDEDSASLSVQAGTLFIEQELDVACTVTNVGPNDEIECDNETPDVSITNGGTLDGDLYLLYTVTQTSCETNGGSGDYCDANADLGLDDLLVDFLGGQVPFDDFLAIFPTAGDCLGPEAVAAGANAQMGFAYSLLSVADIDNTHQGDGLTINYTFILVEEGSDPPAACNVPAP